MGKLYYLNNDGCQLLALEKSNQQSDICLKKLTYSLDIIGVKL